MLKAEIGNHYKKLRSKPNKSTKLIGSTRGIILMKIFYSVVLSILLSSSAWATPKLNFSDLISGPDTGIGDGLGSGVIVTIWGQGLGSSQGGSTITYTDFAGTNHTESHVYYWKNADGNLPGGPANLYESHKMQEIAFSIPDSASGLGNITVTVNGVESNPLPFTVRSGNIYHVKSDGSDSNNGSFSSPWKTVQKAINAINSPGSTLYVHNVDSGSETSERGIYWNKSSASSSLDAQFAFVAYPNTRPTSTGSNGFTNYNVDGQVISKFDIYSSNYLSVDSNGQPSNQTYNSTRCIETDKYGRGVGNRCTDIPGGCASGSQGAINGNALNGDEIESYKMFGNEIYEYGCKGSRKFHHTTYFSIRSGDTNLQLDPWQIGWNYLHDNYAKNGIHMFDEKNGGSSFCGSPNDTVIVNDNVVINQAGAGLMIAANCPWTNDFEVYNNIFINVGLAAAWDGIDPETSDGPATSGIAVSDNGLSGHVYIYNNIVHTWNNDDQVADTQACLGLKGSGDNVSITWNNNICYTDKNKPFVAEGCCGADVQLDNVTGSNNIWYYSGGPSTPPTWDNSAIITDPLLIVNGSIISLDANSPAIGVSTNMVLTKDIYGVDRLPGPEIGAIEYSDLMNRPNPPADLEVIGVIP